MASYGILQAELPELEAELWDLWCGELGAAGSEWIDRSEIPASDQAPHAVPRPEPPPPLGNVRIRHYFTTLPSGTPEAWVAGYHVRFPGAAAPAQVTWTLRQDEAWATQWRQHFAPLQVGRRFLICPPWNLGPDLDAQAGNLGRLHLVIDPGQGFGTGRHASTALALQLLEDALGEAAPGDLPARVLDVGTGSGILLIAARLLGVGEGWGCDVDARVGPEVRNNLVLSGLGGDVRLVIGTPAALREDFPLVLANITAPILMAHGQDLERLTSPGGHLILSGMLTGEADEVLQSIVFAGWQVRRRTGADGWAAAWLTRPGR